MFLEHTVDCRARNKIQPKLNIESTALIDNKSFDLLHRFRSNYIFQSVTTTAKTQTFVSNQRQKEIVER